MLKECSDFRIFESRGKLTGFPSKPIGPWDENREGDLFRVYRTVMTQVSRRKQKRSVVGGELTGKPGNPLVPGCPWREAKKK